MNSLKKFWVLSLLLVTIWLVQPQRSLSSPVPQGSAVSNEDAAALSTLSEYMVGRVDLAHALLRKHGYRPAIDDSTWHQFPSVRKLETAYVAAETASPNRGGEKLLALLASDLAQQYESLRREPSLAEYLRKAETVTTPVHFGKPSAAVPVADLSQPVVAAIDTISQYCSRGAAGTPQSILRTQFGVSENTAYQILRESSSNAEALKRAMTFVPEQQRIPLLKSLVSRLAPKFEAVRYEPALRPFLDPPASTSSPSFPIAPLGPRPSIPSRKPEMPSASERYSPFVRANYSTAESMSFTVMSEVVEGFGGVVFGNQVLSDPHLPRILSISFEQGSTREIGSLTYRFADHNPLSYENVRLEDAYAAYNMVFAKVGGVDPTETGKGVGLISLDDNTPSFSCDKTARKVSETAKFNIILHPALANLDLGWAAVMVDALPIEPELIRTTIKLSGLGDEQAMAVQNLFLSMESPSFVHNWKVVDVPMTVGTDGRGLAVWNSATDASIPMGLRRTAFIQMRPMLKKGFDSGFARDFYQYVPILIKASRDYERLNSFAAVLAVVRLAKIEHATFASPPIPEKVPTPDAIQITDQKITAVAPFVHEDALKEGLSRCEVCLREATASSADLQQRIDELRKLEVARDSAALKVYLLNSGSEAESNRLAEQEARKFEPLIDKKIHQIEAFSDGHYALELFEIEDHLNERIQIEALAALERRTPSRVANSGNPPAKP
jgi:hypothetical protein